ncbi:MAG: 6-carboxytetrahydropterin synthase QueD [Chloroflexi bacterium]|nr:6-carboxytetrahydropterin synthase QueD [Chloroflexota bacterium]
MYEVTIEQDFDAAHHLRGYSGKCERQHGHRFRVAATLRFDKLDNIGISRDFVDLKQHLKEILSRFDHYPLNDIPPFDKVNPSSENIARTVFEEFRSRLRDQGHALHSVTVWESPEQHVTYLP